MTRAPGMPFVGRRGGAAPLGSFARRKSGIWRASRLEAEFTQPPMIRLTTIAAACVPISVSTLTDRALASR